MCARIAEYFFCGGYDSTSDGGKQPNDENETYSHRTTNAAANNNPFLITLDFNGIFAGSADAIITSPFDAHMIFAHSFAAS